MTKGQGWLSLPLKEVPAESTVMNPTQSLCSGKAEVSMTVGACREKKRINKDKAHSHVFSCKCEDYSDSELHNKPAIDHPPQPSLLLEFDLLKKFQALPRLGGHGI